MYTFTIPREEFDELNPNKQMLRKLISSHISKVDRLKRNMAYYEGKHDILNDKNRENKLVCNHARDISDTASSYFIGNPVSYKSESDITALTDALEIAGADEVDGDNGLELSIYGLTYEYIYVKENETCLSVKNVSAENTFMVKDDSIEENELFAVYYYVKKDDANTKPDRYMATVLTPNYKYELAIQNDKTILQETTEKPAPHYMGEIPIIEYLNNKLAIGDFELQIPLIDAYNALMSDRVTDKEQFIDAILLVVVGAVIDQLLLYASQTAGITLPFTFLVACIVAIWIICNEIISILENIKDMGVAIPAFLLPIVEHVKSQVEDKADINKDSGGE